VALAFVYLTLRLPFFAQAKAAYLLPVAPAFAVWFAVGARALAAALARRALAPARATLAGWWTLCAGTFFLGFAA
jgi:multidrug transporter EmrE-like cation transporter